MRSSISLRLARWQIPGVTAALVLLVAGCESVPERPIVWPSATVTPVAAHPLQPVPSAVSASQPLLDSFTQFRKSVPGKVGIAIVAVGGSDAITLGDWSSGVAWSTIKVPLAVAAMRKAGAEAKPSATQAITRSDNAAADRLWKLLGTPSQAAHSVSAVLAEGGDPETRVESRVLRPGYSAFGQTVWPVATQAKFMARLPCISGSGPVVKLMSQVIADQRWGLGQLENSAYKGGWGPGTSGGYLVRQTGLLTTSRGQIAFAIAAQSDSASFGAETQVVSQLVKWISLHLEELPAGHCATPPAASETVPPR